MNCSDNNCSSCISDIIEKILILQKKDFGCDSYVGCDKPFLGPITSQICYNTRPIQLYNCSSGNPWSFNYTAEDGSTAVSNTLRAELLDECCCTCRILALDTTTGEYSSTNEFVTIDLKCCGAIRCFNDTYIELC